MKETIDLIYPVGRTIICDHNPQDDYTWQKWEQDFKDVFPLGAGDTYAAGSTGGEAKHTLTTNEMPKHSHYIKLAAGGGYYIGSGNSIPSWNSTATTGYNDTSMLGNSGDSQAHNNMPPYKAVKFWTRTA